MAEIWAGSWKAATWKRLSKGWSEIIVHCLVYWIWGPVLFRFHSRGSLDFNTLSMSWQHHLDGALLAAQQKLDAKLVQAKKLLSQPFSVTSLVPKETPHNPVTSFKEVPQCCDVDAFRYGTGSSFLWHLCHVQEANHCVHSPPTLAAREVPPSWAEQGQAQGQWVGMLWWWMLPYH